MRVLKRSPWLSGLGLILALFTLMSGPAAADVASDRAGSIVIFPKVIADGTRDTLIALSNTANSEQFAHCFYMNAGGTCQFNDARGTDYQCSVDADCPFYGADPNASLGERCVFASGATCEDHPALPCVISSQCPDFATTGERCMYVMTEGNFDLQLTKQQPTIWRASTGRVVDPTDPAGGSCENTELAGTPRQTCPGIDPGNIVPAPAQPFRGELKCILVDSSGAANGGNWLKGEAIIETLGTPQISKYNSINVLAVDDPGPNADLALKLNNTEYNACPASLEVVHYADMANDVVREALDPDACASAEGCPVRTEITLIPCTQDFEDQVCVRTIGHYTVYDEQESPVSADQIVMCWSNASLGDINPGAFDAGIRGTFVRSHIAVPTGTRCIAGPNVNASCTSDSQCGGAAVGGVCGPPPGVLAVAEEFHLLPPDGNAASLFGGTAAVNVHMVGSRTGLCRGNLSVVCDSDAGCTSGICRKNDQSCVSDDDCDTSVPGPGPLNRCDRCLIDSIDVPEVLPSGCKSDDDCPGNLVCDQGVCRQPV